MKALLLNGGLQGARGNTDFYLKRAASFLSDMGCSPTLLDLGGEGERAEAFQMTLDADILVLGTGTYWDSWGSPLQRYLEGMTEYEVSDAVMGKPAGVIVTMDSVGGSGLMFRLQGVLSSQGMLIPPLSGLVFSRLGAALTHPETRIDPGFGPPEDVWRTEDLRVMAHNLVASRRGGPWMRWPVANTTTPAWPKPVLPSDQRGEGIF